MINSLHARLHRPEKGWDPVPAAYAAEYSRAEWSRGADESLLDELDRWVHGLSGKRVLDLGGGPGHYSVAFAKRKALVTWHDVSRNYLDIAKRKAAEAGVDVTFSLGYLEDARGSFDLVFNRICWYYCRNDRQFAKTFFELVAPGGAGYIDTANSRDPSARSSLAQRVRAALNDRLGLKIGHPLPPHGRIERLLRQHGVEKLVTDYSRPSHDRIFFTRRGAT
jgi:2-polyprenyl-3-methyl-5-hydroxy-6-metoxy-1,4-benzoquinol methylase